MNRILRALAAVLALGVAVAGALYLLIAPPAALPPPPQEFALDGVTLVVPGADGMRTPGRRIEGVGGRVTRIEAARGDDQRFAGMFVLPGLSDAHVHFPPPALPGQSELFTFLMLYHGVTAVRDAGDVDGRSSRPASDGVASGRFPGPRIASCGPFLDGDPPRWENSIVIDSPEEATAAVRAVAASGFDCLKAYDGLAADELAAIREEAARQKLPVIGHVPAAVPYEDARLDDAQHLIGVAPPLDEELRFPFILKAWLEMDDARRDFIIEASLAHGIANTPTLTTVDRLVASRDYDAMLASPESRLLPSFYREVIWNPESGLSPVRLMQPADFDMVAAAQLEMLATVKRMHEAGVELHTGTDTLVSWVVPGAALHRELRLLERAGISPDEVMALSSVATARFLDRDGLGLGSLAEAGPAEFVVFREDPTQDLAALDTIEAVVRDGRLYTREELDAQLERYRDWFEGAAFELILTPLVRQVLASALPEEPAE